MAVLTSAAQAADFDIANGVGIVGSGGSSWSNAATWQSGTAPTATDNINIVNINASKTVTIPGLALGTEIANFSYNETDDVLITGATASPTPILGINGTLTKDGAGTLYFASKNSGGPLTLLVGNIAVNSGTLSLGAASLGAGTYKGLFDLTVAGSTTIASGATLNVYSGFAGGGSGKRTFAATTLNGAMTIAIPGTGTAATNYNFAGLSGASTGTLTTANQVSAQNSTVNFTQIAGVSATYAGSISEGTSAPINIVANGGGAQTLSGTTSYTGTTVISNGSALIFSGSSTMSSAAITMSSGGTVANGGNILGLGNGDLTTRGFGSGAGNIAGSTIMGFAAFGADRTVTMTTGTVNLATANTPAGLALGHSTSTHKLTFTNDINLGGVSRSIVANNGAADIDGKLTGTVSGTAGGVLIKEGAGTLEVTGNNTYVGGTLVNAGTLLVNNTVGSGTGSGAVGITGGATLGGTGTVTGLVTTLASTSVIAAGDPSTEGLLTLSGGLDATAGATLSFELGASSDQISLGSGVFTGSSAAEGLLFNFGDAGGLAAGNIYTIMTFASTTGLDYSDFFTNSVASGFILDNTFGTGGYQINGTDLQVRFSAVPEPSTYVLVAVGLGAMFVLRRRSQKA